MQELPVGLSNLPSTLQPYTDNNKTRDLYKHSCHLNSKNKPHWRERDKKHNKIMIRSIITLSVFLFYSGCFVVLNVDPIHLKVQLQASITVRELLMTASNFQ